MNEADEQVPDDHAFTGRVAARLASVLDCEVADNRHETGRRLVAITLAEPSGDVETLCLSLHDGLRLCRMLAALEPAEEATATRPLLPQPQPFVPHRWLLARSEQAVKKAGPQRYLEDLEMYAPELAAYLTKQIRSLKESIRRHCPAGSTRTSIERRLVTALLVTADGARRRG